MKIAIITVWFNEEDLAPFFLRHYAYVDKIFLFLEASDKTKQISTEFANVEVQDFIQPEGMDDVLKVEKINQTVKKLKGKFDWIYSIDADEFIFPPKQYKDARKFLAKQEVQGFNLVRAKIWQVYRHMSDEDLDPNKPAISQRQHGDPDLDSRFNRCYANKPIVVKPETDIVWNPGCHSIRSGNVKETKERFYGAHWAMADVDIAIKRRIYGRKQRLSKRQIEKRLTWQHIDITEEKIKEEIEKHKHDPNILGHLLPANILNNNIGHSIKINLGSGKSGYREGFLNIDISPEAKPDIIWDIRKVPWTWVKKNTVDYIACDNLFEHIEPYTLIKVIKECHRVLKPGRILWIQVPICTTDNLDAAFSDPTHVNYFTHETFDYYDHRNIRWKNYGRLYGIPAWEKVKQERTDHSAGRFLIVELKAIKESPN